MKTSKLILNLFFLSLVIISCSDDEIPEVFGDFENGLLISAEGNFGEKNGSMSYLGESLTGEPDNFIYQDVNGAQLGGLVQSVAFNGDDAYIILNDVNAIVVADRYTMEQKSVILSGLDNPRYMTFAGSKGYVTNWGAGFDTTDDYIAVVDLSSNTVEAETISLANGVEQIVTHNAKLYITHKGAFSTNNIISVVDLNNDNEVTEITVLDNPDEIFVSNSGNLIVLCEGHTTYNADFSEILSVTNSAICFVDTNTNELTSHLEFPEGQKVSLMDYENETIYYYESSTTTAYQMDETANNLPLAGIGVGAIYGMSVEEDKLYTVTYDFVQLSELLIYDLNTKEEVYSAEVGLGASKVYFN